MGRIRTLKPEFFRSRSLAKVSIAARMTFQGLWCEADDFGRGVADARIVKGAVWPLDDEVTHADVDGHLVELEETGHIATYEVDGDRFYEIGSWAAHQSAAYRRGKAHFPEPLHDRAREQHDESCKKVQAAPLVVLELGRELGTGTGNGTGKAPATRSPVDLVFTAWQEATGHHKAVLDKKRRSRIVQALREYPVDDLTDACRGVRLSPHHRGENDTRTVYDDLELVLRDSAHIEKFRDLARGDGGPVAAKLPQNSESIRRAVAAAEGVQ